MDDKNLLPGDGCDSGYEGSVANNIYKLADKKTKIDPASIKTVGSCHCVRNLTFISPTENELKEEFILAGWLQATARAAWTLSDGI